MGSMLRAEGKDDVDGYRIDEIDTADNHHHLTIAGNDDAILRIYSSFPLLVAALPPTLRVIGDHAIVQHICAR